MNTSAIKYIQRIIKSTNTIQPGWYNKPGPFKNSKKQTNTFESYINVQKTKQQLLPIRRYK